MTDEWSSYNGLSLSFNHCVVEHGKGEYVKGDIYTNTIEGFWALFKRGIIGQYHQLSKKYLNMYLDEFCFRYNNRKNKNIFSDILKRGLNL